jgi:hypothetical protein
LSCALIAGPPSPENPARELPAMRVRVLPVSTLNTVVVGEVYVAGKICGNSQGRTDGG